MIQQPTQIASENRAPSMYTPHAPQAQHVQPGHSQGDGGMASVINSLTQAHLSMPSGNIPPATNGAQAPQYFFTQDGQIVYMPPANVFQTQSMAAAPMPEGAYPYPQGLAYPPPVSYPGYMQGYPLMPYTQPRQGYAADRHDAAHKDLPGLENRRGSYSTTESAPGTPYYGSVAQSQLDHATAIAPIDKSPLYSSPSPQFAAQMAKPLPYKSAAVSVDIDALLQQHPPIPPAVPAVFTPRESMRTLEQSLSNPIYGNRNVYIRGLHPETNDETLASYAARFGRIETSKAIIDTTTGACKGYAPFFLFFQKEIHANINSFGFAKYSDIHDSETCIRAFYKLGYEVGFARVCIKL